MFKKTLKWTLLIAISSLIIGCGSSDSTDSSQKLNLSQWSGKWRSVNAATNHKELESFFEDLSKANPTYSANGIKSALLHNIVGSSFATITIEKDSITFPIFDRKTKKVENKKVAYEFVSERNESGKTMYQFISKSEDESLKSVKYISLMKPHKKSGESFNHWHLLYGSYGFDKLVFSLKGYKPIFVEASVSDEQLVGFFKARFVKMKNMFDNSLKDWNGEWVSLASVIDENTQAVNKVISDLILKFKGKNSGKDFSEDEVKQAMRDFLLKDFNAYETKFEQNNITFIKNSDTKTYNYIQDGTISAGAHGYWVSFKTDEPNAGEFKHLLLSVVHGNPLEFHAKAGSGSYESIRDLKGVPTFFKKPIDQEVLAKELMIFGNIALSSVAKK